MTLDPGAPPATAVAIRGGRVLAVGSPTDVRRVAGRTGRRVDCAGATVLPGLVDAHLHLFALATRQAHLDCSALGRVADVLAAVRARAARTHVGDWVRGEGLDEALLGRLPTAAELDAASPRVPVRLRHRSRHASVLSGRGLARLGPRAGVERRDGCPTGLVHGEERAVSRAVGPLPARILADGLAATARELVALGLTTVADATPRSWRDLAPLRAAVDAGRVPLRVFAMRPPHGRAWSAHGRLHPGPVKVMVEEGPAGLRPSPAALARRIALAAASGPVAVHCLGVSTLVAALDAFAALPRGHDRAAGTASSTSPSARRRSSIASRALGLTVVTNPAFVRERGDVYRSETHRDAWGWLYRARSLARRGRAAGRGIGRAGRSARARGSGWRPRGRGERRPARCSVRASASPPPRRWRSSRAAPRTRSARRRPGACDRAARPI